MLSLYLHIPFCSQVCSYCSFSIVAHQSEETIQHYLQQLHAEIDHYGNLYPNAEIKSIYFGGGTPNIIGAKELIKLITHLEQTFNCENVAELSFEFNPYPHNEILDLVNQLNRQYRKRPRVRYSFGIQSFDNEVLTNVGRPYSFPGMVDFLRNLQPLKQDNTIFNFDFIAFGIFNKTKKGNLQLRTPSALSFFSDLVHAHFADSFSLYTLELSEHQARWRRGNGCFGTEEKIYEEFDILKNILIEAGYARYEISNFALPAKSSIHNRVYWEMENYLGLGLNASSFIRTDDTYGIRFTNTPYLPKYLAGKSINPESIQQLQESDFLIEKFFLGLRTDRGIENCTTFTPVLVDDRERKVKTYEKEELICVREEGFVLTDKGMDCYNAIVTELLKEI